MARSLLPLLVLSLACSTERAPDQEPVTATTSSSRALVAGSVSSGGSVPMAKAPNETPTDRLGQLSEGYGLKVGVTVEDVALSDSSGNPIQLAGLAKQHDALLVVFYRGGWCPYCNTQVRELSKSYDEFKKKGVEPVVISVDQPSKARETEASYAIPFPVLSDPNLRAHDAFNVTFSPPPDVAARMGERLESYSGQDHHKIAVPSVFLLSPKLEVLWSHADTDYKTRPSIEQLRQIVSDIQ